MSSNDFRSYASVEEAEKRLRQETLSEHAHALNNHADNLTHLNQHHERMDRDLAKVKDQMEAVLDSLYQINLRLDRLDKVLAALPADTMITVAGAADVRVGDAVMMGENDIRRVTRKDGQTLTLTSDAGEDCGHA